MMGDEHYCGLDLGSVRTGVALASTSDRYASAHCTLDATSTPTMCARLRTLASEHRIKQFVIGLPLDMRGGEGDAARRVRKVAQSISDKTGIAIELWDERLTTSQALRSLTGTGANAHKKRKELVDQVAAVLILQSWLDAQKG